MGKQKPKRSPTVTHPVVGWKLAGVVVSNLSKWVAAQVYWNGGGLKLENGGSDTVSSLGGGQLVERVNLDGNW